MSDISSDKYDLVQCRNSGNLAWASKRFLSDHNVNQNIIEEHVVGTKQCELCLQRIVVVKRVFKKSSLSNGKSVSVIRYNLPHFYQRRKLAKKVDR